VFTARDLASRYGAYDSKSQSAELQLISPTGVLFGGRLDFVAGLYYFKEDYYIKSSIGLRSDFCSFLVPADPPYLQPACEASPNKADSAPADFNQTATDYAIYVQGDFAITDTVKLTLGGRWTTDDKSGSYVQVIANPFAAAFYAPENTPLKKSDDQLTYRAGLNWTPSQDLLVFASYSTGYKAGGFNSGQSAVALGQSRVFDKETSDNFEIGVKSTFVDARAHANLTLYRMNLNDFQDRAYDGLSFNVTNAGNLRHQGVEADGDIVIVDGLRLFGAVSYLDSEFTKYPNAMCLPYPAQADPSCTQDLKGERTTFAPEWQGSAGLQFEGDLGAGKLGYLLRTDASYLGERSVGTLNDGNPQANEDATTVLSARASLLFGADRRYSVSVFGDNLTDESSCTARFAQPLDSALGLRDPVSGGTVLLCSVTTPRTFGVSFKAVF
jgi:iron complex outermembrane receptor protein